MKTTIEIPDPLFRKAKARAAERGQSLKDLVAEALQEKFGPNRPTGLPRAGVDAGIWIVAALAGGDQAHPGEDRRGIRGHRRGGSTVILDTNALSAFVDGDAEVGGILRRAPRAAIPVIVLGEFRYGFAGSRHRAAYDDWLEANLPHFDVLDVTSETAVAYAAVRTTLKEAGRPIPANDAWIAALALQHRLPVLSRDEHFDAVRGVQRRSW